MELNMSKVKSICSPSHLRNFYEKFGLPRLIICLFLLGLFILAFIMKMDLTILLSASLDRIGMNGLLVLAMLPTLVTGVGLNFGLPVGFVCGLVGGVISMEYDLTGFTGLFTAMLCALPLALLTGYLYAALLERVRGQEMMVGTYVGFAVVAGMCIFWLTAPFKNPSMVWAIGGKGLRVTLTLYEHYSKILNNFLAFKLFGVNIPTGLLLFFGFFCWLAHLFFRTRTGMAMVATGANPMYAMSSGINVRRMRYISVMMSNALAALGAVVYAQSYGFLQLYTAPLYMAFPAVAAALIGGATLKKATVGHIIIGAVLFQTLLTIALPVTQTVLQGTDISEIARMIISNGMILYALTRNERG